MMNQSVALSPGTYHLTFVARNSSGDHQYAYRDITVSSGGGTATTQYQAPLIGSTSGQVTIDTSGNTTASVTGATPSTIYMLEFCPAFVEGEYTQPSCFNVTKVSTGTNGSGGSTVKFPQSGDWAGDFSLLDPNGKVVSQTTIEQNSTTENFIATLLPETQTNGGVVTPNGTSSNTVQDPLTSGSVSFSNGTIVFAVKGASPNEDYGIDESGGPYLDSSGSYMLNQGLMTDGSGNGSVSMNLASQGTQGGDLFQVAHQPTASDTTNRAGFIGGFAIP